MFSLTDSPAVRSGSRGLLIFWEGEVRTHARTHTRTHTRTHARTHTHACTHTHARTHAGMHARMHARTHALELYYSFSLILIDVRLLLQTLQCGFTKVAGAPSEWTSFIFSLKDEQTQPRVFSEDFQVWLCVQMPKWSHICQKSNLFWLLQVFLAQTLLFLRKVRSVRVIETCHTDQKLVCEVSNYSNIFEKPTPSVLQEILEK